MNKRRIVKQIVESVVNKLLINEGKNNPKATINNVQELLNQGYNPEDVFDWVYRLSDDVYEVKLNNKHNLINKEGKIISKQWFDDVTGFSGGFAMVRLYNKGWNFIDRDGEIISDQWFDKVYEFYEGFAVVELNGECNFIDANGKYLSDQWFDYANWFLNGRASVKLDGEWYKIDKKGKLVSDR